MSKSLLVFLACGFAIAADTSNFEAAKKEEQQACIQCHSLRLIHSQRLSSTAWSKEIKKMVGWGARVPDQQILLDYLSQDYGDAKPVPNPQLSEPAAEK